MSGQKYHFSSKNMKILLVGNPPYGVLLGDTLWDLGAFRPDLREYMKIGRVYTASVHTVIENLFSGIEVQFPREIKVDIDGSSLKFINMR